MSVVVALKEKARVYLGSDTLASKENGEVWYNVPKIWKSFTSDNILIGGVGSLSEVHQVRHGYPFDADVPTHENVNAWIQRLREVFKESPDFKFFICGSGKIFLAEGSGLLVEIEEYGAIGSGAELAQGSLFSTVNDPPDFRIQTALDAAITYDAFCGGKTEIQFI
jgi:ATP-dependent protease HslVU (ClpYQ) peptidase subunit